MRFIHIADLHLGAKPEGISEGKEVRGKELWERVEAVVNQCREQEIDLLLIAGDLFHRQPLLRELKELNSLFATLPKTKVVWIAGNHDYVKRDSYYHSFTWNENVFPLLERKLTYIEFPELETCIYGLSYDRKEIPEPLYDKALPDGRQKIEILLAHGGDDRHIPFQTKRLFDLGYDYVALGHIHKPGILVEDAIAYAGALEPIDKNDTGTHGYIEGEVNGRGVHIQFVPFAKRMYRHLTIQVDEKITNQILRKQMRECIEKYGEKDIYKFLLKGYRDPDVVFDVEKENGFGNIIEIVDLTQLKLDYESLAEENQGNLLGRYIRSFEGQEKNALEARALLEGVQALLPQRR